MEFGKDALYLEEGGDEVEPLNFLSKLWGSILLEGLAFCHGSKLTFTNLFHLT